MVVAQKVICDKCGADRNVLKEMLGEAPEWLNKFHWIEPENHAYARLIIENCPECKEYFGE